MKAILICPSPRPATRQLAEFAPLALMPLFGEHLVNHWITSLAERGAKEVYVASSDRTDLVREAVGGGSRWGVKIVFPDVRGDITPEEAQKRFECTPLNGWMEGPNAVTLMSHLPGTPEWPLFDTYSSWHAAMVAWMPKAVNPTRIGLTERSPGIWVGLNAHVAPDARIVGPCWIGSHAQVGEGAEIGPGTILEDRCVIGPRARVIRSHVGPDTFVGQMTCVDSSIAWGNTLVNWRTDSSLRVPDPFLLSSLLPPRKPGTGTAPARGPIALTRAAGAYLGGLAFGWLRSSRVPNLKLPG